MLSNSASKSDHLSQINTDPRVRSWAVGIGELGTGVVEAGRHQFFEQYSTAVYSYLRSILREPDATEEVVQQFAVRVLERSFRGYSPERGRFRDYLKATLRNLVADYWRGRQESKRLNLTVSPKTWSNVPEPASIDEALGARQVELESQIESVLSKLSKQRENRQPSDSEVLVHVMQNPEQTSAAAAAALTLALDLPSPLSAVSFRQMLHRARERFAEMFIEELAVPSGPDYEGRLRDRLEELGVAHLVLRAG